MKNQRQVYFDVGYLVLGKYQEIQLFFFNECGVKDSIPYLEQRSIVEDGGSTGEGCEGKHMHACSLEPLTSKSVQGSTFAFAIVF